MIVYKINFFNNVWLNYNMLFKGLLYFEIWFVELWEINGNKLDKFF